VPRAAASDLAQALTELGASRVDDGERTSAPAKDVSFESFIDTVFELPEFTEETVAVKRPWVVEEVVLARVVHERTEAVRDTLHRRDVAVDDLTAVQ
jgi:stress response protein YsnF